MENNQFNDGKKKTKQAVNIGTKVTKTFGPVFSDFAKKLAKFMLKPQNLGFDLIIIILIVCLSLMLTTSTSSILSTDDMYDKSIEWFTDLLQDDYDNAKKSLVDSVKTFMEKPLNEGGLNCGGTFTKHDDGTIITLTYEGETVDFESLKDGLTNDDLSTTEKATLNSQLSTKKKGCTVTIDSSPSFEDEVEIMVAYITAVNGAISDMGEAVYEEGKLVSDIEAPVRTELNDYEQVTDENGDYDDEETWANYIESNSTKYLGITSTEFKDDFKAYVNHSTADYYYRGETRTENYSAKTIPIFYGIFNESIWKYQFENNNSIIDFTTLDSEDNYRFNIIPDGQKACANTSENETPTVDTATGDVIQDNQNNSSCTPTYQYKVSNKYIKTYKLTIPIFYDLSDYRERELNNIYDAYINNNAETEEDDGEYLTEETVYTYIDDKISTEYQQELFLHNLTQKEQTLRATIDEQLIASGIYASLSGVDSSYFIGVNYYTVTGADGWEGTYETTVDGAFNWAAYAWGDCPDNVSDTGCLLNGSLALHAYSKKLYEQGLISTYSNSHQCTEIVHTWFYDHHGYDCANGNGKQMAENLVKEHSDSFQFGNSPAPGGIISVSGGTSDATYGHVFGIDAVFEKDGELYMQITDGHVLSNPNYTRIMRTVKVSDFRKNYRQIVYAIPIE